MMLTTQWTAEDAARLMGWLDRWPSRTPKQRALIDLVRAKTGAGQGRDAPLAEPLQREAFRLLLVLACLGGELTTDEVARLHALNQQLAKPTPWPRILALARAGHGTRATMAMAGLAPDGKALLRAVWKHEGPFGVVRALLSSVGRGPANAARAARYRALQDLPPDTLGHAFFRHMTHRGLPLPGEAKSLPERAMHHDLMHVITGFDTDARGEGRLAPVYAGMTHRHPVAGADPFTMVMVGLMTFELGYRVGPTFVGAERGVVDPAELFTLIDVGAAVEVDVLTDWNFEAALNQPLVEVRAQFGLPPEGALALLPG